MSPTPLLFFGSPEVAVVALESLLDAGFKILAVVTQPDKPAGRGQKLTAPPVKVFAESKNIPILQPTKLRDPLLLDQLKSYKPRAIVVAAYGKIIPNEILEFPPWGCFNLHFSLLPKYRGASCVASAILNGETETGVTIMKVEEKLDAGPIFKQSKVLIDPNETTGELETRLAQIGGKLLVEVLQEFEKDPIVPIKQDESRATFAPLLKKEDAKIDWSQSSLSIYNQIRAMNPWPIAYTFLDEKRVKIYGSQVHSGDSRLRGNDSSEEKPGTILQIDKEGIEVSCGTGKILLKEVQLEGKKRMNAFEVAQGERNLQIGKVLQ